MVATHTSNVLLSLKRYVHEIVDVDGDHPYSDEFDVFIMSLIAFNVIVVILATVEQIYAAHRTLFRVIEVVSVGVFTIEYLARIWSCTADETYAAPVTGRARFAGRPLLLIDLIAILPFYLGTFLIDTRFLRAFRLMRLFRVFKLARYTDAMQGFVTVWREKKTDLTIAMSTTTILLIVASSLMYFAERGAQPEQFSSIPKALWWGVITLTTVGYGDVYPVTPIGQLLGGVVALLGIGLVALPASILASGFIEERNRTNRTCPHCGEVVDVREDHKSGH